MRRVIISDHPLGVVVGRFLNLFLREVAEGMTQARYWLDCGVNNDSSPTSFFKGKGIAYKASNGRPVLGSGAESAAVGAVSLDLDLAIP